MQKKWERIFVYFRRKWANFLPNRISANFELIFEATFSYKFQHYELTHESSNENSNFNSWRVISFHFASRVLFPTSFCRAYLFVSLAIKSINSSKKNQIDKEIRLWFWWNFGFYSTLAVKLWNYKVGKLMQPRGLLVDCISPRRLRSCFLLLLLTLHRFCCTKILGYKAHPNFSTVSVWELSLITLLSFKWTKGLSEIETPITQEAKAI